MFAFRLWGHFGVFRDPITITQNITMALPPKTTIGGMLASVLGIDYNAYFNDPDYFDFEYSVVLNSPIRKKSFSQNYVEDYTKKSEGKHSNLKNMYNSKMVLNLLIKEQKKLSNQIELSKNKKDIKRLQGMEQKIKKAEADLETKLKVLDKNISSKMTKPKPIRRELLINPSYTVFINNYKYENEILPVMKKHQSSFQLYMGNSEFPANYELIDCVDFKSCLLHSVDSFTKSIDKITFEAGNKYSTMHSATKVVGNREYRDYQKIVFGDCNKSLFFKEPVAGYNIKLFTGEYNCEFI